MRALMVAVLTNVRMNAHPTLAISSFLQFRVANLVRLLKGIERTTRKAKNLIKDWLNKRIGCKGHLVSPDR